MLYIVRSETGKRAIKYKGGMLWNNLPYLVSVCIIRGLHFVYVYVHMMVYVYVYRA